MLQSYRYHTSYGDFTFSDADVLNPQDFVPREASLPVQPWLIHDHGFPLAIVFAESEDDALYLAADKGKLDAFKINDPTCAEDPLCLGNAGLTYDLSAVATL